MRCIHHSENVDIITGRVNLSGDNFHLNISNADRIITCCLVLPISLLLLDEREDLFLTVFSFFLYFVYM